MAAFDADPAAAHGFAGKRFFPATLTNDDPFVADELSLPTVAGSETASVPRKARPTSRQRSRSASSRTSACRRGTWTHLDRRDEDNKNGFQNLETSVKYQF